MTVSLRRHDNSNYG